MRTFVLLAGSYHGGWCWTRVVPLLWGSGHRVHTPSFTGLGDRAHLYRPDIGLATHVEDVTQLIHYEDLRDVVLVAHSYAGVVAGVVADRMPERFSQVIYFDALIPEDGRSVIDLLPEPFPEYFTSRVDEHGLVPLAEDSLVRWGLADSADRDWARARLSAHPLATFTDKLTLARPVEAAGPAPVFVYAKVKPSADLIAGSARRARDTPGWTYTEMDAPHDFMLTHPAETVELLERLSAA